MIRLLIPVRASERAYCSKAIEASVWWCGDRKDSWLFMSWPARRLRVRPASGLHGRPTELPGCISTPPPPIYFPQ